MNIEEKGRVKLQRLLMEIPNKSVKEYSDWFTVDGIDEDTYCISEYRHWEELCWLDGGFPLTLDTVKEMVTDRCDLPADYDVNTYRLFQGIPARVLEDKDEIDLGGRETASRKRDLRLRRLGGMAVIRIRLHRRRYVTGLAVSIACQAV